MSDARSGTSDAAVTGEKRSWPDSARYTLRVVTESRANYWLSYLIDLLCPLVLGYLGLSHITSWPIALTSLAAGVFVFSFVEYGMHRWLFHLPASFATPIHQSHHEAPLAPSALPCVCSAIGVLLFWSMLSPFFSQQVVFFSLCGFFAAYFTYAAMHHLQHSVRIKDMPFAWLRYRAAAHAIHHGRGDTNFGVTTPLWDYVFGTCYSTRRRERIR